MKDILQKETLKMREIIFRFWDKEKKEMSPEKELKHLPARYKKNRYLPMEYVGIKDKNDKKIFEGDRVKVINTNGLIQKREIIGIVGFHFASWGVCIEIVAEWGRYQISKPEVGCYLYFLSMSNTTIEIIGNIHEETPKCQK